MKEQTPLHAFVKGMKQQPACSWKGRCLTILLSLGLTTTGNQLFAQAQQTYTPLAVTGFTQDIVAESGSDAIATTTVATDGSNNVLMSRSFITTNALNTYAITTYPFGLPDNGLVNYSDNTAKVYYNFQLAPYNTNNSLMLSNLGALTVPGSAVSGTLTLSTPTVVTGVSILAFSTEGLTNILPTLNFTDGTSAAGVPAAIVDWYNAPTAPITTVFNPMGRTSRTAPATKANTNGYFSGNTRLHAWRLLVPCASQGKALQSVTFTCTGGSGGSYRAHIMGIAGIGNYVAPSFTASSLPARCGLNNGQLTYTATGGSTAPFTYSWNTVPAQKSNIAVSLAPGLYTCTVTDSNGCTYSYAGLVTLQAQSVLTASASPATVCAGASTTLSVSNNTSTLTNYTWTPGTQTGTSVSVSPTANTTYTVTGQDFYGCTATATVAVTVKATPTASFTVNPDPSCVNTPETVTFTGTAGSSATYDWNSFAGATVKSGTGAGPYSIQFAQPGSYSVQLKVTDNGCSSAIFAKSLTVQGPAVSPVVTIKATTTTSVTFGWPAVPGATGYQVSVNGGAYVDPSSGSYGTTHTVTGLSEDQTVSINVIALAPAPCQASTAGTASGKTLHDPIFAPNSFSPNGDGKNDVFKIYSTLAASIDLKIFNQWGELLFSTTNMGDGWDGTYKGKSQPSGVYIFAVHIKLIDGKEIVRKGAVNLLH